MGVNDLKKYLKYTIYYMLRRLITPKQIYNFRNFSEKINVSKNTKKIEFLKNIEFLDSTITVFTTTVTTLSIFIYAMENNSSKIAFHEVFITGVTSGLIISVTFPISYPLISLYTLYKIYK